jgi:starch phosphorylase
MENLYIFGLRADEVAALRAGGTYEPRALVSKQPSLQRVLEAIRAGRFSPGEPGIYEPLLASLLDGDRWLVLADFAAYGVAQEQVSRDWHDADDWSRRAALSVARMGYFSSDRAIREYATAIWNLKPIP